LFCDIDKSVCRRRREEARFKLRILNARLKDEPRCLFSTGRHGNIQNAHRSIVLWRENIFEWVGMLKFSVDIDNVHGGFFFFHRLKGRSANKT
jgi:hypothetical protein